MAEFKKPIACATGDKQVRPTFPSGAINPADADILV